MKIRIMKLTPETLAEMLRGKIESFSSNLPSDAEILDIKIDLFTKQVRAVIRSESFEDVTESYPIPEFNFSKDKKTIPKLSVALKPEIKLEPKPSISKPVTSSKTATQMENEFSPDQRKVLSFSIKGEVVIVKPIQFLKAEWDDINEVVRSLGGKWVKGDIISYWEIPIQQS